jgi:hypothetical protein
MSAIRHHTVESFVYGASQTPMLDITASETVYVRCLKPYVNAPDAWEALRAFPGAAAFFNKWPWAALPDAPIPLYHMLKQ